MEYQCMAHGRLHTVCQLLPIGGCGGWGGWEMMLTFLELAYMVDATQHDGVGWVGNDVNVP